MSLPRENRLRRGFSLAAACTLMLMASCSNNGDESSVIDVDEQPLEERCLQFDESVGEQVTDFPWVRCDVPHSHEVFHVTPFVVTSDDDSTGSVPDVYPGFAELESFAQRACLEAFEPYVGVSAFDSKLFYSWLVPTLSSWNDYNDHEIVCVAGNSNSNPLEATIRGSQI